LTLLQHWRWEEGFVDACINSTNKTRENMWNFLQCLSVEKILVCFLWNKIIQNCNKILRVWNTKEKWKKNNKPGWFTKKLFHFSSRFRSWSLNTISWNQILYNERKKV